MKKLVKSVLAELNALFLRREMVVDGVSASFMAHTSINDSESILVSPLQAIITPSTDQDISTPIDVGIGFVLSKQPAEYLEALGGPIDVSDRKYVTFNVTVLVRGSLSDAYSILLVASDFLSSLGGKSGTIGGRIDPLDDASDLEETNVILIQDEGESDQSVNDNDDYSLTRGFTIHVSNQ